MPIDIAPPPAPAIVVVGSREAAHQTPNARVTATAEQLRTTTNIRNTEDALRYFPSLVVRKRHIGDTQAPLATRTSGVGASARSLVYADGVLLSALIGNNNNFASPRWGLVSPEEIERVEVLYGPYSAAFPGNAIGAVVNITTRMPDSLEASATIAGNAQHFSQYGTRGSYPAGQLAATVGDRFGRLSWFLSVNHVASESQPLAYVTVARPMATSSAGIAVTGAIPSTTRAGSPVYLVGAGGFERQRQDNLKAKVAVDLPHGLRLSGMSALFINDTRSHAETHLKDANGDRVYAGTVNIDGRDATIPASGFSNQVYRFDERHWLHSVTIEQTTPDFYWSLIGSLYRYGRDEQRLPTTALPAARSGGPGAIVRLDGTGWRTLDAHGYTRNLKGQELHAGAHVDEFTLDNRRFATADWLSGRPGALQQLSHGKTRTLALWAEDQLMLAQTLTLTVGARYEWWRAWNGRNVSAAPALDRVQPERTAKGLSPKASLRWTPARGWSATLSTGRALRFPTVSELYQSITVGNNIQVPDPDLRPERADSAELAIERRLGKGRMRLSLFHESIRDALLSQTAPLPGQTQLFSYVQNIDRTRTNGAELVVNAPEVLPGLDLSGNLTLAYPKIVFDAAFPAAEGKLIPQVPRRKATLVATWRPDGRWSLTGAVRYSSRLYGTIDNSDVVGHVWQGFEGYVVGDVRAQYRLSSRVSLAAGVENVTDRRYFLFHPFPGRTISLELNWHSSKQLR